MDLTLNQKPGISIHIFLIPLAIIAGFLILKNTAPDRVPDEVYQALNEGVQYTPTSPEDPGKWKFKDFKDPRKWWKQMKKRKFPLDRISKFFKQGTPKEYAHPQKGPQGLKIIEDKVTGDYIIYEPIGNVNEVWQLGPGNFIH
jgi:hypothetical protein